VQLGSSGRASAIPVNLPLVTAVANCLGLMSFPIAFFGFPC
jgi:hypothetical protein